MGLQEYPQLLAKKVPDRFCMSVVFKYALFASVVRDMIQSDEHMQPPNVMIGKLPMVQRLQSEVVLKNRENPKWP